MYHIYFIRSIKNGKIYTGFTEIMPQERVKQHNQGSNDWSKHNSPFELIYFESYFCKTDAMMREKFYKSGFGRKIRNLILKSVSARGGSACG